MTQDRSKTQPSARRPWTKPEIRRLVAGSAESAANVTGDLSAGFS